MAQVLDFQQEFTQHSERVKFIDHHSTEPWILTALYSGHVQILDHKSQTIIKSFKVTDSPVRCTKFIERKNWIVTGSDDKFIRVFNYNTTELVKEFEAHNDYIRCINVHPSLPYILSSSDDKSIKMWDWENEWRCTRIFEGHSHYVMQAAFNPIDNSMFSTASLDGTVTIWDLGSDAPIATLEGHSKGVNCVDYFVNVDKLYLLTGSDDYTIKVWDCETKCCVQTMEGHTNNVCAVCVHPEFDVIISASEDETIRIWDSKTYKVEKLLNYSLGRVWTIGCIKNSHQVAFGCDNGTIVIKINGLK